MAYTFHFSAGRKHKRVESILEEWKKKGSYSDKICELIEAKWDDENKGAKMDAYTKGTQPIDTFPTVIEEWTPEKLQHYNIKDLQEVVDLLYKRRAEISAYLNQLARLR